MTISDDPNFNEAIPAALTVGVPIPTRTACVYCGSSHGADPMFAEITAELGTIMAKSGVRLVYGGGRVGLMGVVADAVMDAGGEAIGIIPQHLHDIEPQHNSLTELIVVDSMHTRKRMMADRSQAFVILPGGFGTMDECFEIITWKHLRLHNHPIVIFNVDGYWEPLLKLIAHMVESGFAPASYTHLFNVATTVDEVMGFLLSMDTHEPVVQTDIR